MIAEFRRGLTTRLLKEWIAKPRGRGPNLNYTPMQNKAFACAVLVNPYEKDLHSLKGIFEQERIATAVCDIYTSWTDFRMHLFTLFDQEFRTFQESIGVAEHPDVRRRLNDAPEQTLQQRQTQRTNFSIQDFLSPRHTRMSQDVAEMQAATAFSTEVRRYLGFAMPGPMDTSQQTRENIAEWWSLPRVQHAFPVLRKFVVQIFCIMPSNATVEGLWSSAKFIVGTYRQSLSEETYKGLLLSYCNQDLLE